MIVPKDWECEPEVAHAGRLARRMLRHIPETLGMWCPTDTRADIEDVAQNAASRLPNYGNEAAVVNALKQARADYWRQRATSGATVLSLEEWRDERKEASRLSRDIIDAGGQGRIWTDPQALRAFALVAALERTNPEIVRLAEKRLSGVALSAAERKQLQRFRQAHRGMV